jgi:hypothetical protein
LLSKNEGNQYYFYSFSNFLAAFGGGMILGKGIGAINVPFLQGGSVQAFFVGSVLGLGLLQFFPKKWAAIIPPIFSSLAAATSLILLFLFKNYSFLGKLDDTPAIIFFLLLCIRFGFWFYSRVLRASLAAGKQQKIAWVELGYYTGMISGLIIWKFLGITIGMIAALALDAALQFSAGALDLIAKSIFSTARSSQKIIIATPRQIQSINTKKNLWVWRLASAVMLLTVGIQVVIFSLAHHVSEYFSSYIIAFYYLGVSIAALTCKKLNIQFAWDFSKSKHTGYATINSISKNTHKNFRLSLSTIVLLAIITVVSTIFTGLYSEDLYNPLITFPFLSSAVIAFLACITASAFFYEIVALSLIDRIGSEEKEINKQGMVIRTYGLMAIAAALSLWLLSATNSTSNGLIITLLICLSITIFSVRKRNLTEI